MLTLTLYIQTVIAIKVLKIGVKTGDWIKYDYTFSADVPPGTPFPEWLKAEFLSVEDTTATACITLHMSDGTEQNQTLTGDLVTGEIFSGFVIPANSTTGDSIYIGGYGYVNIAGETRRTYAGASRTVVYASFLQYDIQLTYYWDKQTGVLVEASVVFGDITGAAKATETNMWQTQPTLTNISVYPFEITVSTDEVFTINVTVAYVADLYAWQVMLSFDNSILHCTGAWYAEDHVFAGKELVPVEPVIDNTDGYVLHGCCLLGDEETFNGNGTLLQIQFRSVFLGSSSLEFSGPEDEWDTFLIDFDANEIPIVTFDGYVMVEGGVYCDLNNDGKVDVQDFAVAANAFGSCPGHRRWNPIADLNKDSIVNMIDMVLIARNFGK